jgi:hypothetical protein
MSDEPTAHVSAMEGGRAYAQHSRIPAAGGGLAIPLLEEAERRIALDAGDRPIAIADYGSSDGKNSLAPMRAAIAVLRGRVGQARPNRRVPHGLARKRLLNPVRIHGERSGKLCAR